MTIWDELSLSGIFPCKDDRIYEEDEHDGDIGIKKSFYFNCVSIIPNFTIYNVSVIVYNNGSYDTDFGRIDGPITFDFTAWIKKSENGIRTGMRDFLQRRKLID